jgi:uncharacterized membrane protein
MMFDGYLVAAVIGMGVATYGSRLAGYWLLRDVAISGRWKAALDAVPPAILMAVIAPSVFLGSWIEWVAAALTLAAALLRAPLLVSILLGVGTVAVLRYVTS